MEGKSESPISSSKPIIPQNLVTTHRIFVSGCNSLLGYSLIDELRNDHIEDETSCNKFIGTFDPTYENDPPPSIVQKLVTYSYPSSFTNHVLSCDVIIYHLPTTSPAELRFIISKFKECDPQTEKTLILISDVSVWGSGKSIARPFEDREFPERKPLPSSAEWKLLENEALLACRVAAVVHPRKRSYVVCAGKIYGLGEEYEQGIADRFMEAWNYQGDGDGLTLAGEGTNVVPTIHIKDLCKMIGKLVQARIDPQENPYLIAVDKGMQTQYQMVESIVKKFGVPKISQVRLSDLRDETVKEAFRPLTINVKMNLSGALNELMKDADWHCRDGFVANVDKVFDEFKAARGLRCLKILLIGPPLSGKTHFADWLSQKFGVTAVHIKETLNAAQEAKDEYGNKIREALEEIKRQKVEELTALAKKKRGMKVEPELIVPRFTDEMICRTYARRLAGKVFQNKGYILDGFPRTYIDAEDLFLEPCVKKSEEDQKKKEEEAKKKEEHKKGAAAAAKEEGKAKAKAKEDAKWKEMDLGKINSYMPNKVILLEASEEVIMEKANAIPEETKQGTHYDEEGMTRRMQEYMARHDESQGFPPLVKFFEKRGIEVLTINVDKPEEEKCKLIEDYIEKEGKMGGEIFEERAEMLGVERDEEPIQNNDLDQAIKVDEGELQAKKALSNLLEYEQKLLELHSYKMRHYLTKKVIPILGEGILQICREQPEDPIETLMGFLMKKSTEKADEEREKAEQKRQARELQRQQRLEQLRALEKLKEAKQAQAKEDSDESSHQH